MSLRKMLDEKLDRFEELEKQLVDPDVLSNPARVAAAVREHGSLAKLAKKYRRFKDAQQPDRRSPGDDRRQGRRDARNGRGRAARHCATSAKRCGTSCWR